MSHAVQEPLLKEVTLRVMTERATIQQVVMQEGASVMVGSGANCGIRLNSMRISSIHCLLQFAEGHLMLQDWCSMLGTTVNGARVEEQCELKLGDVIRLGEFAIEVSAPSTTKRSGESRADSGFSSVTGNPPPAPTPSKDLEKPVATNEARRAETEPTTKSPAPPAPTTVEATVVPAVPASELLAPRSDSEPNRSTKETASPKPPTPIARPVVAVRPSVSDKSSKDRDWDPWSDDTVALLQAELETLQSELRDRDQELRDLKSSLANSDSTTLDNRLDQEQAEALVARLEDLLDELGRSDQRVLALEDLLRAEQERATAEQEERQQMEDWLGGIEQRLSERESEWSAERSILQSRLEQLRSDREQLDRHMQQQAGNDNERAMAQMLQDLRSQLDSLQQRLDSSEQARSRLEQQLETATAKTSEEMARDTVEEAVREERLRLAQERATLSRDRAELARRLAELNDDKRGKGICEADERFNALRQTLKETRDKEPETPVRKPSLGARLADLWRRLDGPTDTD